MRLSFKDIQRADADWPRWIAGVFAALILIGALFEVSGRHPAVAVGGIVLLLAVVWPLRQRQLRRRLEALRRQNVDGPSEADDVRGAGPSDN